MMLVFPPYTYNASRSKSLPDLTQRSSYYVIIIIHACILYIYARAYASILKHTPTRLFCTQISASTPTQTTVVRVRFSGISFHSCRTSKLFVFPYIVLYLCRGTKSFTRYYTCQRAKTFSKTSELFSHMPRRIL